MRILDFPDFEEFNKDMFKNTITFNKNCKNILRDSLRINTDLSIELLKFGVLDHESLLHYTMNQYIRYIISYVDIYVSAGNRLRNSMNAKKYGLRDKYFRTINDIDIVGLFTYMTDNYGLDISEDNL